MSRAPYPNRLRLLSPASPIAAPTSVWHRLSMGRHVTRVRNGYLVARALSIAACASGAMIA
jgi:hypothetical protein